VPGEVTQDRPSASSPVPTKPSAIATAVDRPSTEAIRVTTAVSAEDVPAERATVEVDLPVTARDLEHAYTTTS
jgi:hypothetical protein